MASARVAQSVVSSVLSGDRTWTRTKVGRSPQAGGVRLSYRLGCGAWGEAGVLARRWQSGPTTVPLADLRRSHLQPPHNAGVGQDQVDWHHGKQSGNVEVVALEPDPSSDPWQSIAITKDHPPRLCARKLARPADSRSWAIHSHYDGSHAKAVRPKNHEIRAKYDRNFVEIDVKHFETSSKAVRTCSRY